MSIEESTGFADGGNVTTAEVDLGSVEPSEEEAAVPTSATPRIGVSSMLTRDSDLAVRKGFRSPPNAKSKAQRSEKPSKKR